jgi:hypothetical protein
MLCKRGEVLNWSGQSYREQRCLKFEKFGSLVNLLDLEWYQPLKMQ